MEHVIKLNAEEVAAYLDEHFPQLLHDGREFVIEEVGPWSARVRMHFSERFLRPGGTISGPAQFMLADLSMYIALLGAIGPIGLAVTTNLSINFLRKPDQADMLGEAQILKLGKRLAVGEIALYSEGDEDPVAHATATYSIPPEAPR